MFHSRGTVQSSAGVPDGTSWTSSGTASPDDVERRADAVAGDAATDREQLAAELVQLVAEVRRNGVGLLHPVTHGCSIACGADGLRWRCGARAPGSALRADGHAALVDVQRSSR